MKICVKIIYMYYLTKERFAMTDTKKTKQNEILGVIFEWAETFIFSLAAVVLIFTLAFKMVLVDGDSMNDTMLDGDRLIVSNLFYTPKAGDVVVLDVSYKNFPDYAAHLKDMPLIKRVIATEGQTVDIDRNTWTVLVDGEPLDESAYYVNYEGGLMKSGDITYPHTVADGCVFVMGDNRNHSSDSRTSIIGDVDARHIVGKVIFRIFPLNKIGTDF